MFAVPICDQPTFLEPRVPRSHLPAVAAALDRYAENYAKRGRHLFAAKARRRAGELRKAAAGR